jgi:hypothetical protein
VTCHLARQRSVVEGQTDWREASLLSVIGNTTARRLICILQTQPGQPAGWSRRTDERPAASSCVPMQAPAVLIVLELVFLVDLVALPVPLRHCFAAAERSRHERFARSAGIALRRPCGDLLARDRGLGDYIIL